MGRTPLTRTRPLRARSSKQAAIQRARRRVLADLVVERGPWCQARLEGCDGLAVDGHEPGLRSQGADPADPDQIVLVCRACHGWIHGHPAAAYDLGLLTRREGRAC